jgi:D-serine deaminase-like pyridoxal phosphate-dependent protein
MPPAPALATIDHAKVLGLARERLSWRDKAIPPTFWGRTVAEVLGDAPRLSQLPTPLLTLSAPAMAGNIATLAQWCDARGLSLAPHGKTTMAPALWARQVAAGAWAITVANFAQLAVARAFGVSRVMVANTVISPLCLRWIADELVAHPELQVLTWADSLATVAIMDEALTRHAAQHPGTTFPQLDVLVERGAAAGRTGARDEATALEIARAVGASGTLRLAGVAGYEGALAHEADEADEASLQVVRSYLRDIAALHAHIGAAGLYPPGVTPVITAGGSAFFDVVADVLAPLTADGARVVLRSGAYVSHDDGFYRRISPLGAEPRTSGARLVSAMHGWVRITSQPEPGLALFDAGKRDLPFDEGLPEPQLLRPRTPGELPTPLGGILVSQLNDQHGFLRFPPTGPATVHIGDELRLGLSHPCTAFDKWGLIPMIDDPDSPDPVVVDLLRTFF